MHRDNLTCTNYALNLIYLNERVLSRDIMPFQDGDFLEIELSEWDTSNNSLIYTTDQEKAKQAGLYDEKAKYAPVNVVLGRNTVIAGLDRELRIMNVNEQKKFTFEPKDAFGGRNEGLVKVVSLSELRKRDIDPYPGMGLSIEGQRAIVKSVNSGRVVIDMNNPFADKQITCEVKIARHIDNDKDKVVALSNDLNTKPEQVSVEGKKAMLTYGSKMEKGADHAFNKAMLIASVFKYTAIEDVAVTENYNKKEEEEMNKKAEAAEKKGEEHED